MASIKIRNPKWTGAESLEPKWITLSANVTKDLIESVLTGTITSHNHDSQVKSLIEGYNFVVQDGSKVLSDNNFTNDLKTALETLNTTTVPDVVAKAAANEAAIKVEKGRIDTLTGPGATEAIDTFKEIETFLGTVTNKLTLTGLLKELENTITAKIPSKTSQLTNDDHVVKDASYVHTDANFTEAEKTKLSNIAENANNFTLEAATASKLGGVKVGTGIAVTGDGTISLDGGALHKVAQSGDYNDLNNKPNLSVYVEKKEGWDLSENNYDDLAVAKLASIEEGANKYTLPEAGAELGGVKTGGDVTINAGAITVNDNSHNHTIANVTGLQEALDGKASLDVAVKATEGVGGSKGLMSAADKEKLDGIEAGANKYTLPIATTELGGVKNGGNVVINAEGKMNVSEASTSAAGLMSKAHFDKLEAIEAGAQVNTVTSVAGKTGAVPLTKEDVGLSNVDNTSDAKKPISEATKIALNDKQNTLVSGKSIATVNGKNLLTDKAVDIHEVEVTEAGQPKSDFTWLWVDLSDAEGAFVTTEVK